MPTAILLAALSVSLAAAGDNWPQFRGPLGNGVAPNANPPLSFTAEGAKWETPIHDCGWSSPVVWGKQVWVTTATEDGKKMYAVAVDRESGKILHDLLIFENEEVEPKHALNSYASPTPAVEEGRVYVHFGSYGTACIDTSSGRILWTRRDLKCRHFRGPGSSPLLSGDLLYLNFDGFDDQYLVALDKRTGKTVWKTERKIEFPDSDGDFRKAFSTPILIDVAGKRQLVSSASRATMAYDPLTGEELWRVRCPGGYSSSMRPVFAGGLVIFASGFGKSELIAVRPDGRGDVTDTHIAWRLAKGAPQKPSPVVVDGLMYLASDGGVAMCIEVATGKVVWLERLGGEYSASALAADGRVYFFSHAGKVTVIAAGREFKRLAESELPDGFMATPAALGDTLILRTKTQLMRFDRQ